MKNSLTALLFLFTSLAFAQEAFVYNENGLQPEFLVVETEGKTQQEIFDKALDWIKDTYKNPDEVLKATIGNEKIRFEGVDMDGICHIALGSSTCYPTSYSIEIEFKDGKYKFAPLSISYRIAPGPYNPEINHLIPFESGEQYFNKKGKLRSVTRGVPPAVEVLLNDLNTSLSNYITEESAASSDW